MVESWVPVSEFPEHYEVSDLGRFRRLSPNGNSTFAGRILRAHPTRRGYLGVTFTVKGVRFQRRASRVVAEAFLGPIEAGLVVNHIDGDVINNAASNLEIVTQSENARHALDVLGVKRAKGQAQHLAKLSDADIPRILEMARSGVSHSQIAAAFGVSKQAITAVLTGKTWRHISGLDPAPRKRPNKLSKTDAQKAVALRKAGWTQQRVADHFGVSKGAINDLCAGRTWKSVRR